MNNKKIQVSILTVFLAATLVGSVAAFGVSSAYADEKKRDYDKDKKHDGKDKNYDKNVKYSKKGNGNSAEQAIEQAQLSSQNSQCVAGGSSDESENGGPPIMMIEENSHRDSDFSGIFASCNNVGLQFQNNDGNLALGQQ